MASHRVRRQRWQVRAASADDAFALRSALRRENEASLLPALERAFAELDDEAGRDIHLPRLTIKLSGGMSTPEIIALKKQIFDGFDFEVVRNCSIIGNVRLMQRYADVVS